MADSATPVGSTAPSAEYEDEDFDVVNAERIEGVEEDEDTADEDPQDVAYEEDGEVRPSAPGLAQFTARKPL
jgi:hypothetical protein